MTSPPRSWASMSATYQDHGILRRFAVRRGRRRLATAYYIQLRHDREFHAVASIWYLGMLIVGGSSSPLGAILGTCFHHGPFRKACTQLGGSHAAAIARNLGGGLVFAATNVVLGASILLALIFEPRGLAHRWACSRPRSAYGRSRTAIANKTDTPKRHQEERR